MGEVFGRLNSFGYFVITSTRILKNISAGNLTRTGNSTTEG